MAKKMTCTKCGRTLDEVKFWKIRSGERYHLCKDCLTQYIDNRDPETFMWILKEFDVPYIRSVWVEQTNKIYMKNPAKFGPASVIGTYLRMMHINQYKNYTFADSDKLNDPMQQKEGREIDEEKEKKLKERLENGEISEAEYQTLSSTTATKGNSIDFVDMDDQNPKEEEKESTSFAASYVKDDSYWASQLTKEDIDYLILKWGVAYTPQQWISMEKMYSKYADEYDLNSDREEVLKKMCKTSLKMDMALDTEDITAYKNLATVFDQLRKSGKFTESQKKEEKREILSTIGELAALCEQEGGIIPNLPQFDPNQYPQDKIDFTLKDLKSYIYSLVSNELGLGDLIESYISKLEKAEKDSVDINVGLVTSAKEEEAQRIEMEKEIEDEEKQYAAAALENDIEAEAEELLNLLGEKEVF